MNGHLGASQSNKVSTSSGAADTTVVPVGDNAVWRTLDVCPVSEQISVIEGNFHMVSWFCEKP